MRMPRPGSDSRSKWEEIPAIIRIREVCGKINKSLDDMEREKLAPFAHSRGGSRQILVVF